MSRLSQRRSRRWPSRPPRSTFRNDLSLGETVFDFVMFFPVQALPVALLYRSGPEMSAMGAWGTLVLAVVATVGGHIFIVAEDSSTAALGFLFFPFWVAIQDGCTSSWRPRRGTG